MRTTAVERIRQEKDSQGQILTLTGVILANAFKSFSSCFIFSRQRQTLPPYTAEHDPFIKSHEPFIKSHSLTRTFHQKSTSLTPSTLGHRVVHFFPRNSPNLKQRNPRTPLCGHRLWTCMAWRRPGSPAATKQLKSKGTT